MSRKRSKISLRINRVERNKKAKGWKSRENLYWKVPDNSGDLISLFIEERFIEVMDP